MSKTKSSRQALALAALLVMSASASAAEYSIEPILSPDNGDRVVPTSIASNGLVVGKVYGRTKTYCFKYIDGVFATLPQPPETLYCRGAVTDLLGNITLEVVPSDNPNTSRLVELSTKGVFRTLTGQSPDGNTVAASVGGRMAGSFMAANGEPQAYLFDRKGTGVNVGALTGMTRSWLTGLNAKGLAVGWAWNSSSGSGQAFRYQNGKIVWLSPLAKGRLAKAFGINASGTIVGMSQTEIYSDSARVVSWQGKAAPVNLGAGLYTEGSAINSSGLIVGYTGYGLEGIRVREGVLSKLFDLIPPEQQLQWTLLGMPSAINDNGLIAGFDSRYNGNSDVAYLLRPLP